MFFGAILNDLLKVHVINQKFDLILPASELKKWTIVLKHNDAEFAED